MSQSPTVAATTANPAAGTVVTEMKTPTSAADFADTSDSMPAAPANNATTNDSGPTWKMKSTSDSSRVLSTVIQPTASPASTPSAVTSIATGKPTSRAAAARRARYIRRRTSADGQRRQRTELGSHHHRPDHGHRRVGDHADRGDQARQAQERHVGDVERGLFARARRQFVPHHGVGGIALGLVLGPVRPRRQHRVDEVEGDRAAFLDPERLEPVDDLVGRLPGDVGGDLVPSGIECRIAVDNEVRRTGVGGQKVDHRLAKFGWRDYPQMQHARTVAAAMKCTNR